MGRSWLPARPHTAHKQGEGECRSSSQKVGLGWRGPWEAVEGTVFQAQGLTEGVEAGRAEGSPTMRTLGLWHQRRWRATVASQREGKK